MTSVSFRGGGGDVHVAAVIVAAGRSRRMGRLGDKIWINVAGRPVLFYSIRAFLRAGVPRIIIAARPGHLEKIRRFVRAAFPPRAASRVLVVRGGRERQDSVWNGIAAASAEFVLVHDAARPAVSPALIKSVLAVTRKRGACVPAVPVADTLKRLDGNRVRETVSRSGLFGVQTPQGFRSRTLAAAILAARRKRLVATDCATLVEALGKKVMAVPGNPSNIKLTRPADLEVLNRILSGQAAAGG